MPLRCALNAEKPVPRIVFESKLTGVVKLLVGRAGIMCVGVTYEAVLERVAFTLALQSDAIEQGTTRVATWSVLRS